MQTVGSIVFAITLLVGVPGIGAAGAQEGGNVTATPEDPRDQGDTEGPNTTQTRIDEDTVLVSSSYNPDDDTATVVLRSTRPQTVTLVDIGGFVQGGEVNRRRVVLPEGTSTLELQVTKERGIVGVSISTSKALYAVPLRRGSSLEPPVRNWFLATGSGTLAGLVGVVVLQKRLRVLSREGVTRVDG